MAQKRITITEASKLYGVSERTIRRRISTGELKKVVSGGKTFIVVEKKDSQERPTQEKVETNGSEVMLQTILEQLKEKDEQIKRLDERLRENNILLLEFRHLLPAPKENRTQEDVAQDPEGFQTGEIEPEVKLSKKWQVIFRVLLISACVGVAYYVGMTIF